MKTVNLYTTDDARSEASLLLGENRLTPLAASIKKWIALKDVISQAYQVAREACGLCLTNNSSCWGCPAQSEKGCCDGLYNDATDKLENALSVAYKMINFLEDLR